jgi:septal ring factor EnvC (AmiA/AmiB activator)
MSNYHLLPAATLAALLEAEQAQHAITKNAYANAANTAATQSELIDGLREEVADLKAQLSKVAVPVSKIEAERDHFQKMNRDLKDKNVNLIKGESISHGQESRTLFEVPYPYARIQPSRAAHQHRASELGSGPASSHHTGSGG